MGILLLQIDFFLEVKVLYDLLQGGSSLRMRPTDLAKKSQSNFGQSILGQANFGTGVCHSGAPKGGGVQNFAICFSLWVFSRGILVVFEAPAPTNVHVWSSRVVM